MSRMALVVLVMSVGVWSGCDRSAEPGDERPAATTQPVMRSAGPDGGESPADAPAATAAADADADATDANAQAGRADAAEAPATRAAGTTPPGELTGLYRFSAEGIDGKPVDLSRYKGKVLLIVNVASKCGNTRQYAGLQTLYEQHKDAGLVVLGFPANDFGRQEPGTNAEIQQFCESRFGVTFPMFAKIHVKGDDQHPLYAWLTDESVQGDRGGEIGWNFTKFLVGRDGQVIARFAPGTPPSSDELVVAVKAALDQG